MLCVLEADNAGLYKFKSLQGKSDLGFPISFDENKSLYLLFVGGRNASHSDSFDAIIDQSFFTILTKS